MREIANVLLLIEPLRFSLTPSWAEAVPRLCNVGGFLAREVKRESAIGAPRVEEATHARSKERIRTAKTQNAPTATKAIAALLTMSTAKFAALRNRVMLRIPYTV